MISKDSIIITVNGTSDASKASEDIFKQIFSAAKTAVKDSAAYHLREAISNVNNAYTTAGYPKISFMYARWLAARNPDFKKSLPDDWDYTTKDGTLDKAAKILFDGKTSMISGLSKSGPSLIEGLRLEELQETSTSVSQLVVSDAKYSKDLEYGYLFGKYRGVNKKRPFFTGHITTTKSAMRTTFKESLEGIR